MRTADFYRGLRLFDLREPKAAKEFRTLVTKGRTEGTYRPLERIISRVGAEFAVVEEEYVDEDFTDDFHAYYYRVFPHRLYANSIRIHFFTKPVHPENYLSGKPRKGTYLGFCILRPIPSYPVGRTVLTPFVRTARSDFVLCQETFSANLLGMDLAVTGMPFIQQDTNVGVCGEAALWMTTMLMHKRFGYPKYFMSEINRLATGELLHTSARDGLMAEQMTGCLRELGYNAFWFPKVDTRETAKLLYAYVESGLPVIVLLKIGDKGHAVVAIGHDLVERNEATQQSRSSTVDWVEHFYVHDDAVGPYGKLSIRPIKLVRDSVVGVLDDRPRYSIPQNVVGFIAVTPREVLLRADDVYRHAATAVATVNERMDADWQGVQDLLSVLRSRGTPQDCIDEIYSNYRVLPSLHFSSEELQDLVYRPYLISQNQFKNCLPEGMLSDIKHLYRGTRFPKYLWVVELSKDRMLNVEAIDQRRVIGELTLDSTADRHAVPASILGFHLFGRVFLQARGQPLQIFVGEESPYEIRRHEQLFSGQ